MPNQPMTEIGPSLPRKQRDQIFFNFYRILMFGQPQAIGQSGDMGVNDNAFVKTKSIS